MAASPNPLILHILGLASGPPTPQRILPSMRAPGLGARVQPDIPFRGQVSY